MWNDNSVNMFKDWWAQIGISILKLISPLNSEWYTVNYGLVHSCQHKKESSPLTGIVLLSTLTVNAEICWGGILNTFHIMSEYFDERV
jgi:hypothetical protein